MNDCVFCKIIKGEISKTTVYEDDKVLAIIPLGYVNKGHVLVIPRKHSETLIDIEEEDLKACIVAVKKVSQAIRKATKCDGLNLHQNNFKDGGQEVAHIHFHVIPRFKGDGLKHWKLNTEYAEGEKQKIAEKIKSCI